MGVLTGDAGVIAGGEIRNGVPVRLGLVFEADARVMMMSAGSNSITSTVSYGDFATEMRRGGTVGYQTVGWLTLTATGDDYGYTEV
ncbi:MAG TPA: hypothetical protein VGJ28_12030, partial [Micromonosporaceae bacterium]